MLEHARYKAQKRHAAAAKLHVKGGGGGLTSNNGSGDANNGAARHAGVLELKDEKGRVICPLDKSKDYFLNTTQLVAVDDNNNTSNEQSGRTLPLIPHEGVSTKDPRPLTGSTLQSEKTVELMEVLLPRLVQETQRAAKSEWDDDYNEIDNIKTDVANRQTTGDNTKKPEGTDKVSTAVIRLVPCLAYLFGA